MAMQIKFIVFVVIVVVVVVVMTVDCNIMTYSTKLPMVSVHLWTIRETTR